MGFLLFSVLIYRFDSKPALSWVINAKMVGGVHVQYVSASKNGVQHVK